ncbi:hypothetical protein D3C75_1186960 [compost metagenome]
MVERIWELNRIEAPVFFSSSMKSSRERMPKGSSPKNGSSITYSAGRATKAHIIMTFCFIPLDKCEDNVSILSSILKSAASWLVRDS